MIRLYGYELSRNCYKIGLLLGFLGLEWETRRIDFHPGRENKSEWFLGINQPARSGPGRRGRRREAPRRAGDPRLPRREIRRARRVVSDG